MPVIRSRNGAMLFVLESVPGTFQAPSAATDAILVEAPQISFDPQNVETNEVTGSFDGRGPLVGGMKCQITGSFYLKGQGKPGLVPEWGDLMKAGAWSETVTKTDLVATTFAAVNPGNITDSGSGLAVLTIGTVIYVDGFVNAANNGEFIVTASAAGSITVTKLDGSSPAFVAESAGPSVTIRRGLAAVAATAGAAFTATLQAPWAASAQLYRGMPAVLSGNPAVPAFSFISDYTVGRLASFTESFSPILSATTKAALAANVLYQPVSNSIPSGSCEYYIDGVLYRFKAVRGSVELSFTAGGACKGQFTMSGLFVSKTDAAVPVPTYDSVRPPTWRNSVFNINRLAAALSTFSLNTNGQLEFPDNPNSSEGFDGPEFTGRRVSGSMDPYATLVATRDIMTDFRAGASRILHARATGGVGAPGNRVGLTVPSAFYESYSPGDKNGLAMESVGYFAQGQDTGAQLVVY